MAPQRAAIDFSRAMEQRNLAAAEFHAGRPARAAELYGRAVAAAKEQRPPADCLVTAFLVAERSEALMLVADLQPSARTPRHEVAELATTNSGDTVEYVVCELLPPAIATLERRAAAGTLLTLRLEEEAWFAARRAVTTTAPQPLGGGLGGYETFLLAADVLLTALFDQQVVRGLNSFLNASSIPFRNVVAMKAAHAFVLRALELLATAPCIGPPRVFLPLEAVLARHLRVLEPRLTDDVSGAYCCPPGWDQEKEGKGGSSFLISTWPGMRVVLADAWARVQRAPPFRALGNAATAIAAAAAEHASLRERAARASEAPKLRTCVLPACNARELHVAQFKYCAACHVMDVSYCSKEHQIADWPRHKPACKAARKAAGAAQQ